MSAADGQVTVDGDKLMGFVLSTLLCVPASLGQDVGLALGPQAGEGADPGRGHLRRLQPVPPGERAAVQPRVRGTPITPEPRGGMTSLSAPNRGVRLAEWKG